LRPLLIPAATVIRRRLREARPRGQCGRREELRDPVAPHPYSPLVGGSRVPNTAHLGWRGLAELMVSHAERDEVAQAGQTAALPRRDVVKLAPVDRHSAARERAVAVAQGEGVAECR
jgi:hypothetical protein